MRIDEGRRVEGSVSKRRAPEDAHRSVPKKFKKLSPKKAKPEAQRETPPKHPKHKAAEIIPLLKRTIENILSHKDGSRVTREDCEVIEECLEQMILREVSMETLIESGVGKVVKRFYEFVHAVPELKVLDIITRCAFKKLKKRVIEALFGVKKTLPFSPDGELDTERKPRPKSVKAKANHENRDKKHGEEEKVKAVRENGISKEVKPKRAESKSSPKPNLNEEYKEFKKESRRVAREKLRQQELEFLSFSESGQDLVLRNLHKNPKNPNDTARTIKELAHHLSQVSKLA